MQLSTVTQLIALIVFSIMLNVWPVKVLSFLMLVVFLILICQKNQHFFRLLKRLKWFFAVMFLIFLFNTPGEHIVSWSYRIKPTYEGLEAGITQLSRIVLMLAALSMVLKHNTMQQMISGLYGLLKPLAVLGVNVERFAARLCLTMHYLEQEKPNNAKPTSMTKGLAARLEDAFIHDENEQFDITLTYTRMTWLDYLVMIALLAVVGITIMLRG